ncbi:hypothetical protein BH10ACI1_BH10ACI1_29170 [soil metagenome]
MQKKYLVKLDDKIIGFSYLEMNDAPMGVVFGKIYFEHILSGYEFFSNYCKEHNIPTNEDDSETRSIDTQTIKSLTVIGEDGTEINGIGAAVTGFGDEFEVEILGVPYPFYGEEFPHHVEAYENHCRKLSENLS